MNVVLLTSVMFTLALVHGHNPRPCKRSRDNNAHNTFVQRHILQESFDKCCDDEWRKYLEKYGLCNGTRHYFMKRRDQTRVVNICNGHGWPLHNTYQGNLCISNSTIPVYDLTVSNNGKCKIEKRVKIKRKVVVACDKVQSRCRPVHFERYTNQRPNRNARPCSPRAKNRPRFQRVNRHPG